MGKAHEILKRYEDEIIKCMKCGNCQAVCPVYKETSLEGGVARGKIQLAAALLNGSLEYTKSVQEKFQTCLTCMACNAACPCGVKPDQIILAARAALAEEVGLPFIKKSIFNVVSSPGLFDFGMKVGSKFQGLALKKQKDNAFSPRFPVGLDMKRVFPSLAPKAFKDSVPEVTKVENPKFKVAFFTGCVTNYIYTSVGHAAVNVLAKNGVEVVVPKAQHCCGAPVLIHGDRKTAGDMAKSLVETFSKLDIDAVITPCGTCGESFQHNFVELLAADPQYGPIAKELAKKTYDISEFLIDKVKIDGRDLKPVNMKVTYHDPCHLVRGMNVSKQPREILNMIPGLEFVEMKNAARCCGGAGSFTLTHYDMSMSIHQTKINDINSTGASTLVTGCGSCRMQFEDGLYQAQMGVPVLHTIEILNMAYK
ncbi:MAG: (Fe-S)-binding protein [Bacillota bacterium]|nr:(Fe-S)-binding protein [Bacillota bacterium]